MDIFPAARYNLLGAGLKCAKKGADMPSKVPMSSFLLEKKPQLRKLVDRLNGIFAYASVLGSDVAGKNYRVANRTTSIENTGERGFVARVYENGRYFEHAFNQLPEDGAGLDALVARIAESAKRQDGGAFAYPLAEEEEMREAFQGEVGQLPSALGPDKVVARLAELNRKASGVSPLVVEVVVTMGYAQVSKVFLSAKKDLEQSYVWAQACLFAIARRDEITRVFFKAFSGVKGPEILDEVDGAAEEAAGMACKLLDAKPVPPGEHDVIFSPDAVGLIAHEAFGHGVELDMFLKNRANAERYIGKAVASPIVRMRDGARAASHNGSYLFDDEGNMGGDTLIIEDGILRAGISDALSAMRLGLAPTGNGRRESYARKAYSRMTNTIIEPGKDSLEDMIASVKRGYFVDGAESGMEDPKDWGIQCMFSYAREIVDGKLTDNLVAPVVMTGYVPDLLKAITMVSTGMAFSGAGYCGKGHKEYLKVSCGGPYIKTKARLG